ncbi:MAG TPA: NADH-quinone oxidoreductase subunit J [Polyangiaceae bacterium]|nr:NADH-quinone oxidoreductase subunit J [Polyangiaceae bacterium]
MSMPTIQQVYFSICAALAVAGAVITVLARNPIRGAMGLLLAIGGMAALFLSLSAEFLAAVQLLVYAGAVVVLFLFVIMLLGPDAHTPRDKSVAAPRLVAAAGALLVASGGIATILFWNGTGRVPAFPPLVPGPGSVLNVEAAIERASGVTPAKLGTIEAMANEVYVAGLVPFEIASALLLVAVVGAVAVARGRQGEGPRRPAGEKSGSPPAPIGAMASAADAAAGPAPARRA